MGSEPLACSYCVGECTTKIRDLYDVRFGINGSYHVAQCGQCGLWQTFPRPTNKEMSELYARHYNFAEAEGGTWIYEKLRGVFLKSRLYDLWMKMDSDPALHALRGGGRLLDVGCNEGRSLQIFGRRGFLAEGLEPNPRAAEKARALGFVVHEGLVEELSLQGRYDVVVMANVLEHASSPLRMLGGAMRVLKPGGKLLLSTPNVDSWMREIFGRSWINWHVPFHLTHFSRSTVRIVLEKAGFVVAQIRSVTPAVWISQSCIVALTAKRGQVTSALHRVFPLSVLTILSRCVMFPMLTVADRRGRGDCLLVEARRPPAGGLPNYGTRKD